VHSAWQGLKGAIMSSRQAPQLLAFASKNAPLFRAAFTPQHRFLWCWAACASMLRDLLGKAPKDQCKIAGERLGLGCCGLTLTTGCVSSESIPTVPCDQTQSAQQIDQLLTDQGITFTPRLGKLLEPDLDAQVVTQGKPVLIYKENSNGSNHVFIVLSKSGDLYMVADPCETGTFEMIYDDELLKYRGAWKKSWIDLG
jgi:hypothetical protein